MLHETFYFTIFMTATALFQVQDKPTISKNLGRDINPSLIAICDVNIGSKMGNFPGHIQDSLRRNHRDYAFANNYSYHHQVKLLGHDQSPYYTKILLVKKLLLPPHNFRWILLIDSDALFVNSTIKVESILEKVYSRTTSLHTPSLIFSGDTNVINTGLLLFRRSRWTLELLDEILRMSVVLEKWSQIGMGGDNVVFAMYLVGCSSNCSLDEFQKACSKLDIGFDLVARKELHTIKRQITSADWNIFEKMVSPRAEFQAYTFEEAKFVEHFPGKTPNGKN